MRKKFLEDSMFININNFKFFKKVFCLLICASLTFLSACTGSKVLEEVTHEEVIKDMTQEIESETSFSTDLLNKEENNDLADQTIGSTDYDNENNNSTDDEVQTVFTPISQQEAIVNANNYLNSLASELNMPANYKTGLESTFSNSNNARLAELIKKALKGENITIATIGGSITNGAKATSENKNYPNRIYAWFEKTFPNIKVKLINAGIGSTTSAIAAYRINEDVLSYDPDLIVLEFAVNDVNAGDYLKASYEALVRNAISYKDTAVICLYLSRQTKESTQSDEKITGDYYSLPQVSELDAYGEYSDWDAMFADNLHPNDLGHARIGLLVDEILTKVLTNLSAAATSYVIPSVNLQDARVFGNDDYLLKIKYTNSVSFFRNSADVVIDKVIFNNKNYSLKTKSYKLANHEFSAISVPKNKTLELEIKDVRGLCILMYRDADGGNANITIVEKDTGKATSEIVSSEYSQFAHVWNTKPLYTCSDGKKHTVIIKIESTQNNFSIVGFGISD